MGVEIDHRAPVAVGEDAGRVVVGRSEVASGAVQGRDEHGDGRARHLARLLWNETECGLRYPWEDAVLKDRCQRFQLRPRDVQLTHDVPQRVRRHELECGAFRVYSLPRKINDPEVLPMADVRRTERRRLCQSRVLPRTEPLGQRHQIAGRRRRDVRRHLQGLRLAQSWTATVSAQGQRRPICAWGSGWRGACEGGNGRLRRRIATRRGWSGHRGRGGNRNGGIGLLRLALARGYGRKEDQRGGERGR